VKVKLVDIYNSVPVMNKILETPLPASVSFQLSKLLKTLNDEMKSIEEQRIKLVEKYGNKSETQETVVSEENKEKFLQEFSDLLNTEVEVTWHPLSSSKFDALQLSVNEMSRVQFLFSE
jgi:lipoate-protein ligase A